MQKCKKCQIDKNETEFSKDKKNKNGLDLYCKKCRAQYRIEFNIINKETIKQQKHIYYQQNKQRIEEQKTQYRKKNKEIIHKRECAYRIKAREKIAQRCNQYQKERRKSDPLYKLITHIRSLIYHSVKKNGFSKNSKTQALLSCSYEEFLEYLGPKPEGQISLDHICPCYQAQNEEELIKLQHYTNFRWLNTSINISKSDNKTPEAEEMCRKLLGREWID